MKLIQYPLTYALGFFIVGILISEYAPISIIFSAGMICAAVAMLLVILLYKKFLAAAWLVILLVSVLIGWFRADQMKIENQPHHYGHNTFEAYQVELTANPEHKPNSLKVDGEVKGVFVKNRWIATKGKILLYFNYKLGMKPKIGDWYVLNTPPRLVEGPKNPEEFNYKLWLKRRGILHHHFIKKDEIKFIKNAPSNQLLYWAGLLNQSAETVFARNIPNAQSKAVATAMVLGTRDQIDQDLLQAFSATGAVHILSVSGMHVAILYAVLAWLLLQIPYFKNKKKSHSAVLIFILWLYALLTGLSVTVIRATVMFTIVETAKLLSRKTDVLYTLVISAFLLLFINPLWLFDVGFQLSYLAIVGIVVLHQPINSLLVFKNKALSKLWEISSVAFSAQLLTFPLSIFYFHQFPVYFLLANPFVFLFSEGILPLGLLLLICQKFWFLAKPIGTLINITTQLLNLSVAKIEALPYSVMAGLSLSLQQTIGLYVVLILFLWGLFKTSPKISMAGLLIGFGLVAQNYFETQTEWKQNKVVVHYIPRGGGISFIEGKTALFVSDSASIKDTKLYGFHLKNLYDDCGILKVKTLATTDTVDIYRFKDKTWVWLHKFPKKLENIPPADVLLVSKGSLRYLQRPIDAKMILIDDSNWARTTQKLKTDAEKWGIPAYSLYETGAKIF